MSFRTSLEKISKIAYEFAIPDVTYGVLKMATAIFRTVSYSRSSDWGKALDCIWAVRAFKDGTRILHEPVDYFFNKINLESFDSEETEGSKLNFSRNISKKIEIERQPSTPETQFQKDWNERRYFSILGNTIFAIPVALASTLQLGNQMGFIDTAKTAHRIGNRFRIFSPLAHLSLDSIINVGCLVASSCFAIQAGMDWRNPELKEESNKNKLTAVGQSSEAFFQYFALNDTTNSPFPLSLGLISAGINLYELISRNNK